MFAELWYHTWYWLRYWSWYHIPISGNDSCDAERQLVAYDLHPRFKNIEANCIEARLQLAALFAATGSLLPELDTQKTGGEVALELVRQCWVNCPLTKAEQKQLLSVSLFDQHVPALSLLCHNLSESSTRTSFLHMPPTDIQVEQDSLSLMIS